MRYSLLIIALGGSISYANASFDLVFVADKGTDSIHRFDGDNGVYLGNFGAGMLSNPNAIVADKESNLLIVADDNGIFQFDLWSGNLRTYVGIPGATSIGKIATGRYYFGQPGNVPYLGAIIAGSSGWFTGQTLPNSSNWIFNGVNSNGKLMVTDVNTKQLKYFNTTGVFGTASLLSTRNLPGGSAPGQGASNAYWGVVADKNSNQYYLTSATDPNIYPRSLNTLSTVSGIEFAHDDVLYAAGRDAANTSGLLTRTIAGTFFTNGTYGSGILQNPSAVSVVIAPEPGTMIALSAGILALVRRRKSA
jgi:hypothetical protein